MPKHISSLFFLILLISQAESQSNSYGLSLGSGLSYQRWQGGSGRNPLPTYHIDYYMDSESENGNIIYGILGYHLRGSRLIFTRFVDQFGNIYPGRNFDMRFYNACLEAGLRKAKTKKAWRFIYGLGVRGEYTLKHKLEIYQGYEDFIRRFNYGFTLSGSIETKLNKFIALGFDARISPDLSRQIYVPAAIPIYDPFTGTIGPGYEQSIRNLNIEFGIYIRLIQLIKYID